MLPLLLIAAIGAGLGTALQLSRMMPTFQSIKSLREAIPRPVLGSVSLVMSPEDAAREKRNNMVFAASIAGLVAVDLACAVWAFATQAVA
jgi:hypothetical protein